MFAIASLAYFLAAAIGWGSVTFRTFYLFGAILNVPYLALGTVYLLGGVRRGDRVRQVLDPLAVFCAGVVLSVPFRAPLTGDMPSGKEVFGPAPRIMAAVGSGVASLVLVGGALWSAVRLLRLRGQGRAKAMSSSSASSSSAERAGSATSASTTTPAGMPGPGRLALTNVLIAAGTLVLGTGGTLFGTGDRMVDFGIWLATGITLLFAGFLVSNPDGAAVQRTPYWQELHDLVRTT